MAGPTKIDGNRQIQDGSIESTQLSPSLLALITGNMDYKGTIDASVATGDALDGATVGDFFLVSVAGTLDGIAFSAGDHLVVNSDITDFSVDGAGKIDIVDNTESSDIVRDADIVDDLTTGGATSVLSAEQGVVLKGLIDAIPAANSEVCGETPAVTDGSAVLPALANIPLIAGSAKVHLNGLRQVDGGANDYTINDTTGVITFNDPLETGDCVVVDYKY